MVKIGISGILGRMGRRILSLAKNDDSLDVILGLEKRGHPQIGEKVEEVVVTDNPEEISRCDCLIEFTTPEATVEHLSYLVRYQKATVIGTTGLNEKEYEKVTSASKVIPIVFSPNMSVGVNLLFKLVQLAASVLKNYGVYIEEAHHIHKKDAPSGTAKKIAQIINSYGFNVSIDEIKAVREDEIVGDHRIVFESEQDKIELFHSAKTRDIFAQGAIISAKWVVNQNPGMYSMEDVLNI